MKNILSFFLLFALLQIKAQPPHCIKIEHTHFYYYYDTVILAPIETVYIQTTAHAAMGSLDRTGFPLFHEDTLIPKRFRVARKSKYQQWNRAHKNKRRDTGHSAPYTALAYDSVGAIESMNYQATGPQASWFNEHPWEGVEMYVLKKLAPVQDSIQVFTGFIYDSTNAVPSPANIKYMVDVPEAEFFWKVTKYSKDGETVYKAWLGLNDESNRDNNIDDMLCPVERIEALTGLSF